MDFAKKTLQYFSARYAAYVLEIITSILLVRSLGATTYGIYTIAFLIPNIIVSFGSLSLGPAIIYHLNRKKLPVSGLFFSTLLIGTLLGAIYYLSFYLLVDPIQAVYLQDKVPNNILFVSMLLVPIRLVQKYTRA